MRRLIPALSLTLVALVAGCGTDTGGSMASWTEPSAASAGDPAAVIKQAMQKSLASTLTIEASVKVGGQSIKLVGKADPAAKAMQLSGNAPEAIEARVIKETAYLKMDAIKGDKPWMKIDFAKLRPNSSLRQSFDIQAQTGIIGGIATAEKIGDGRYRGTADLAKAAAAAGSNDTMRKSLESGATLAKDPKAIPFEATVDGKGRLTALSYTIATKSLGDLVTDVKLSGFGEPVSVQPPAANQVGEAPAEVYTYL